VLPGDAASAAGSGRMPTIRLDEAGGAGPARSGIVVVESLRRCRSAQARAGTLFGEGQVEQHRRGAATSRGGRTGDRRRSSSPAIQQRNLEDRLGAQGAIDRHAGLILFEIFGERAATAEGRLQVELAHLDYQGRAALARSCALALERQRGGFGFLGGPGEDRDRGRPPG